MKNVRLFLSVCLTFSILFLSGCASPHTQTDDGTLHYPSLPWGTAPDETIRILKLSEGNYTLTTATGVTLLSVPGMTVFGEKASEIQFCFYAEVDAQGLIVSSSLSDIYIFYPTTADMNSVREKLIDCYGNPQDEIQKGRFLPIDETNDTYETLSYLTDAQNAYWASSFSYADYLGADATLAWISKKQSSNHTHSIENLQQFVHTESITYVVWSTTGSHDFLNLDGNIVALCSSIPWLNH